MIIVEKIFAFHNGYNKAGIRFNQEPPIMSYLNVNAFEEMINDYRVKGCQILLVDSETELEVDLEFSR
jgi:hypothetical protein